LRRTQDELDKTVYESPIDGVVTSLPVHVGEQMVPGIQNSPGSYLMTVADMSGVTAEVRVDESDVIDVKQGQPAEVTIDAYPDSTFKGQVVEIGTTALLRSTGQSTSQISTGSQEAKDFKVVIQLTNPPSGVRPGLSSTAKITTARRDNALAIPIQALSIRKQSDITVAANRGKDKKKSKGGSDAGAAAAADPDTSAKSKDAKKEVQGVFVVVDGHAQFRAVKTGITGVTDIEVLDGLKDGDEIVTGSYKVLRDLKPNAKVRKSKSDEAKPSR
jgi:HlyD family secretion protein